MQEPVFIIDESHTTLTPLTSSFVGGAGNQIPPQNQKRNQENYSQINPKEFNLLLRLRSAWLIFLWIISNRACFDVTALWLHCGTLLTVFPCSDNLKYRFLNARSGNISFRSERRLIILIKCWISAFLWSSNGSCDAANMCTVCR